MRILLFTHEFALWTSDVAKFIKLTAPNQPVMDSAPTLHAGDLLFSDADVQDPHFYPMSMVSLGRVVARVDRRASTYPDVTSIKLSRAASARTA